MSRMMTDEEFQEHITSVRLRGFTLLPEMLTREECAEAQAKLEQLLESEKELPGVSRSAQGVQVYALMNKARVFERVYQIPPLLRVIRHFLGEDAVLSSIQAHVVYPGAPAQGLHADGSITGPNRKPAPADEGRRITSHALGFNVVFCVSEFTRENGATRLVPGSHHIEHLAVPQGTVPGETIIEAERGSVLMFNISTWHGASAHRGSEPRYAVMTPWRRQWLRPEADLSRMVHPDALERAGEEGRVIFGFPARSPYIDRWQWDWNEGRPKEEWRHLERD